MTFRALVSVIEALESEQIRYLVVGGVAVNAHGYSRATRDLDLVLQLAPDNVRRGLAALETLGYRPSAPVPIQDFADPDHRIQWRKERNMEVFSLVSDRYPSMAVDLFVEEPFDFDEALKSGLSTDLSAGLRMRVAGIETMIRMKEAVGRPRDLDDVAHLRALLSDREGRR